MKYKYIVHWFHTPRDRAGNLYSCFQITDTKSGRSLKGKDVTEANLRVAIYYINGEHKQNYYFASSEVSTRAFKFITKNVPYIGCDSEVIASTFKIMMKSRKK